ncbi:hypothetical protein Gotri_028171, partial [Gossypium trilobum]|nr:hypothetical protein [Gossypium trilobum]
MLNFSHNNFTGPIPASFGNLVALESLDLSSNKLGSSIPSEMTNLTFLEVLNLSENNFVGPIPHGNQFDTFDNDSYSNNLGLCGLPLSKQCINHEGDKPPSPLVAEHDEWWREIGNTISQGGYEEREEEETSSASNILLSGIGTLGLNWMGKFIMF